MSVRGGYVVAAICSFFLTVLATAVWALDGSSWDTKAAACRYAEVHNTTTSGSCSFYETASTFENFALVVGILSALTAVGLLFAAISSD